MLQFHELAAQCYYKIDENAWQKDTFRSVASRAAPIRFISQPVDLEWSPSANSSYFSNTHSHTHKYIPRLHCTNVHRTPSFAGCNEQIGVQPLLNGCRACKNANYADILPFPYAVDIHLPANSTKRWNIRWISSGMIKCMLFFIQHRSSFRRRRRHSNCIRWIRAPSYSCAGNSIYICSINVYLQPYRLLKVADFSL